MKKILSLVLALVMVLSMAVVASAVDYKFNTTGTHVFTNKDTPANVPPYRASGDVTVEVTGAIEPVYYVDVEWKAMTFTYTDAGTQWNPETHMYGEVTGGWSDDTITDAVVVTNHSNAKLFCKFTKTGEVDDDGIEVTLSNTESTEMESAAVVALGTENIGKAAQAKTNVRVDGAPDMSWINDGVAHVVATVVATISLSA